MALRILLPCRLLGGAPFPVCQRLFMNPSIRRLKEQERAACHSDCLPWMSITQRALHTSQNCQGLHEPDYLDIKGYDYTTLEEFGKYVHHTAERFNLEVEDAWATPGKQLKINRLKPDSTVVEAEYKLQLYERNVQQCYLTLPVHVFRPIHSRVSILPLFSARIDEMTLLISDVPSTILPLFINIVETTLPSGVSLSVHPHFKEHTEIRYVPDLQLKELRGQLDSHGGTVKKFKQKH